MRSVIRGGGAAWLRAVAAAVVLAVTVPAAGATDFTRYHDYQQLTAALKAAVAAHGDLARLVTIGKTHQGRDLWAVEIASRAGTPVDQRPALLVAANLEGDHLVGSEIALYLVEFLLSRYSTDPAVKQRLDHQAIYVVPRMNPDAAELMFAPVKAARRTNASPTDADNDGRLDENGPEDLNKDGVITVMRVKDPKGRYMVSPDDPRVMKKADPAKGEAGGYAVYWEGRDTDGDGFIAEDAAGGTDINRNFMHQYPYYQPDAGRHMASEAETRALLDYVLAHRNIAAILTFGESDNLVTPPNRRGLLSTPAPLDLLDFADASTEASRTVGLFAEARPVGRGGRAFTMDDVPGGSRGAQPSGRAGMPAARPAVTVNAADLEYFRAIGEKYRELTGIRSTGFTRAPAGAFFEYGYYQYGVPSFSTPGWGLPAPAGPGGATAVAGAGAAGATGPAGGRGRGAAASGAPELADAAPEGVDARLLQWMDAEKVDGFLDWTPFTHPTLGAVEIGGFKPFAATNPPAGRLAELGAGHARFVLFLSSLFPQVKVARAEASALGGGLYRVKAEVENRGFLPTALAHAVNARAVTPIVVQLGVPPEAVVAGHDKTTYLPMLPGSGGRQAYEWLIEAKPGTVVTVKAAAQKGGTDTATITLK